MDSNYISSVELIEIINILAKVNETLLTKEDGTNPEVTIGDFKVFDINGEVLGTVSFVSHEVGYALFDKDYNPNNV